MVSTTTTKTLNRLAAITWHLGWVCLYWKAGQLVVAAVQLNADSVWTPITIFLGIGIGVVKAKYLFVKNCRKNLQRISRLTNPKLWQFFRPQFFVFLTALITAGFFLSRVTQGDFASLLWVAGLDIAVGTALLLSSREF